jgi:outer membrane receptor for ferrienterochelin and colicins
MSTTRMQLLFVSALMAIAMPAAAQTGTIAGKVTSVTGTSINGAQVRATVGARTVSSTLSDQNGDYRLPDIPPGTYTVSARRIGFREASSVNVNVSTGFVATANLSLEEIVSVLEQVITTASRAPEKVIDAPASVSVINEVEINERPSITVADHVAALPGMDVARGGLMQSNIVARGFNNIFSGSLLTLTDNRFAFVPSLRVNIPYLSPTTNEDIERVEVVLGPGAALYGPNTAGGVMHVITRSPFSSQGTTVTLDAGERSVLRGGLRHAGAPSAKFGYKISLDYFQGNEWRPLERDSLEQRDRDFDLQRMGGEVRLDYRPTAASEIIGTYGYSKAGSAVEPTGLGPAQVTDWAYQTFQLRSRINRLFAQVFLNTSDAGETFLLRTLQPIVDKSNQFVAQVQHGLDFGSRQSFLYGLDYLQTTPKTEGSINGRNEEDDDINEVGGYLHSVTRLHPKFEVTAAARVDKHSRLDDAVFSPRVALVFKPAENQNVRFTYNRAFSTPSTNNLFLDLLAGRVPTTGTQLYGVRALGVPSGTGLTFGRNCTGGVSDLCMRVPAAFGGTPATFVPANAAPLYPVAIAAAGPSLTAGLTAAFVAAQIPQPQAAGLAAQIVGFLGTLRPTAAQVGTKLRLLNTANGTFNDVDPSALRDVAPIKPTINNTFEVGYKGIIGNRLQVSLDAWREDRKDFVGPLILETPNVFLDAASLAGYLGAALANVPGLSAAQRAQIAATVAGGLGGVSGGTGAAVGVPLGVVNFSEANSSGSDIIVTYRNFGELEVWGGDIGAELLLDRGFSLEGTFSYVNKDFFPKEEVGGVQDISLNAPGKKGSLAIRYRSESSNGMSGELRGRHVSGFPVYSFINGNIGTYNLIDAGFSIRPAFMNGAMFSVFGTNLLNNKHVEFVGGGEIGRLIMTRLQVTF